MDKEAEFDALEPDPTVELVLLPGAPIATPPIAIVTVMEGGGAGPTFVRCGSPVLQLMLLAATPPALPPGGAAVEGGALEPGPPPPPPQAPPPIGSPALPLDKAAPTGDEAAE